MLECAPASQNLRRYGNVQVFVQAHFLVMGIAFWIVAKALDVAVMSTRVYGEFIGQFPAEWWAGSIILASGTFLAGIIINGNWRWSVCLRLVGATWHVLTLSAFAHGGAAGGAVGGALVLGLVAFADDLWAKFTAFADWLVFWTP